jgi:TolB-like protein
MSPEQLRGEALDQRTDIWSLGAVLYEMVAGRRAFAGESVADMVASILDKTPLRASVVRATIPAGIERVIERALEKDLRRRYERTEELIHDLIDLQSGLDTRAITRRIPAEPRTSLAVLPFEDMSETRDQGFLCDGIAEEIMRALGRIPELHVVSRTSAFQFRNRTGDIREIGAKLNVNTVLEGSVRRVGERVRISAQLVSIRDGYRLWYERYDREMKDLFAIEDEIAEQIARWRSLAAPGRPWRNQVPHPMRRRTVLPARAGIHPPAPAQRFERRSDLFAGHRDQPPLRARIRRHRGLPCIPQHVLRPWRRGGGGGRCGQ